MLAATVRVTRDLDVAEEAVQDAYVQALEHWPRDGVPANPGAWLTTVARRRALDVMRPREDARHQAPAAAGDRRRRPEEDVIGDDRLRLVFICCHPALAREAQVALTLRLVCGVATADVAHAFLVQRSHDGGPDHPRQEEDRRRADPVRRAGAGRAARPPGRGADRHLPALHDRPHRARRRRPRARRADRARARPRAHAARAAARRAARPRGCSRCCCATKRAATPAPTPTDGCCGSPSRTAAGGTASASPRPTR